MVFFGLYSLNFHESKTIPISVNISCTEDESGTNKPAPKHREWHLDVTEISDTNKHTVKLHTHSHPGHYMFIPSPIKNFFFLWM